MFGEDENEGVPPPVRAPVVASPLSSGPVAVASQRARVLSEMLRALIHGGSPPSAPSLGTAIAHIG